MSTRVGDVPFILNVAGKLVSEEDMKPETLRMLKGLNGGELDAVTKPRVGIYAKVLSLFERAKNLGINKMKAFWRFFEKQRDAFVEECSSLLPSGRVTAEGLKGYIEMLFNKQLVTL